MEKSKPRLCIIFASDPSFLGGLSLYQKNLISSLKDKMDITLVHKGVKGGEHASEGVKYVQIKTPRITFLENLFFEFKVISFLKREKFDIINSQGFTGLWMNFSKRPKKTKIVHTYHGSTYFFYKNHLKRFRFIKKILLSPALIFPYFIEKSPMKKADKIICNSEHVKNEMMSLYGKRKNIEIIRTGVDLKIFKLRMKIKIKKNLGLDHNKLYGLYVGRGGYWTKGLDKVINLSEKIYILNKNFRLIVIGSDKEKVNHLIKKDFIILLPPQPRDKMPFYYDASDVFFSMSRCEGGAPTMVTSEAMASGCLIITDEEAKQEIIDNEKNGLVITNNYKKEAKKILNLLKNKNKLKKIIENSLRTAKNLSLDKWSEKYLNVLLN